MDLRKYTNKLRGNSLWNAFIRCADVRRNSQFYNNSYFGEIFSTNPAYTDIFQFILVWMIGETGGEVSFLERLTWLLETPKDDEYMQILKWYSKQPKIINHTAITEEKYWEVQKEHKEKKK